MLEGLSYMLRIHVNRGSSYTVTLPPFYNKSLNMSVQYPFHAGFYPVKVVSCPTQRIACPTKLPFKCVCVCLAQFSDSANRYWFPIQVGLYRREFPHKSPKPSLPVVPRSLFAPRCSVNPREFLNQPASFLLSSLSSSNLPLTFHFFYLVLHVFHS
jgi:hypothetical protein